MSKDKKTHRVAASITHKTDQRIDLLTEELFCADEITFLNRSAVVEILLDLGYNTYRIMHPKTDLDPETAAEIRKHAERLLSSDKEVGNE